MSGGYKDDEDYGDVIIYTGHGGRDGAGNQVSDQSSDDPGNAALITSERRGSPVRVIRGKHSGSPFAPSSGYRYDGLYRVDSHGSTRGIDGFLIWQFRMVAYADTPVPPRSDDQLLPEPTQPPAPVGTEKPERVTTTVQRIVRNSAVKNAVKAWHEDQCQTCGTRIEVPGGFYSEGAHIQALGTPYHGPDSTDNVLCLCPNCHVMFDFGAIVLTDELVVLKHDQSVGPLRTHPRHSISLECVRKHRERWRH